MSELKEATLTELLNEWAELEASWVIDVVWYDDDWGQWHLKTGGADPLSIADSEAKGIIQAAVQEAIEGRGWRWQLDSNMSGKYYAAVFIKGRIAKAHAKHPNSVTHAILAAYLEALRAHQ